jgi:hypothetical protein
MTVSGRCIDDMNQQQNDLLNAVTPFGLLPERIAFIDELIARGGPEPHEYAAFTAWVEQMGEDVATGVLSRTDCLRIAEATVGRHLAGTMWHSVLSKPHGYHGDFETIDGIYT